MCKMATSVVGLSGGVAAMAVSRRAAAAGGIRTAALVRVGAGNAAASGFGSSALFGKGVDGNT